MAGEEGESGIFLQKKREISAVFFLNVPLHFYIACILGLVDFRLFHNFCSKAQRISNFFNFVFTEIQEVKRKFRKFA